MGPGLEQERVTRAAITFDTGALFALERRKERAIKVYTHAKDRNLAVATPNVTIAEWWRGRTDRREEVLRGLLVEPPTDRIVKMAGMALAKVRGATAIDAIVAAFAAERTGVVYTSDADDLERLRAFFPALRVFSV